MKPYLDRAAFYLICGSLVSILFSIAASQILLGLSLAALLLSSEPLRLPPIKLPLGLFLAGTVISWLASGHIHDGTPQIRKFFVFTVLLVVYSTFRKISEIRALALIWAAVATLSAVRSLFQFAQKYQDSAELHRNFYEFYIGQRITGFMSHWMTFGGEEMIILLFLLALLFFSIERRWKAAGWFCAAVLAISLVLGFTRSIFLLGFPVGLLYLLWFWHKWMVAAVPVLAVIAFLVAPVPLKERVTSIMQPHGQADSNLHRSITRRTGIEMIRAHPLLGLGPEVMKDSKTFDQYVPADIPRPLPEGWYGHLHNIYIQYAAERGIPTMLAMLWLIGKVLWDFASTLRAKFAKTEARFVLHGAIAVILAILAEGLLEYNLGDSEVLTLFLAMIAFGYVAKEAADVADSRA
ncbi:MAG TPA: O-antigen ligase family protein [Bryobacteraceae bacterium]|nr:O-antigen ligase family protein [Bryobacteraceae bacterium]